MCPYECRTSNKGTSTKIGTGQVYNVYRLIKVEITKVKVILSCEKNKEIPAKMVHSKVTSMVT